MSLVSAQEHRRSRRPGWVSAFGYRYYTEVTIQASQVEANHSNFPILISGTFNGSGSEADLRTVANGGKIENTDANGGASGSLTVPADFVVSPYQDGSSPYDHEFEKYDPATGEIAVWVKIPTMDSISNKTIYMVYGDSGVTISQENVAGVWDANYLAVYHMAQDPSGTAPQILDSTSNNHHASAYGSMTSADLVDGQAGKAIYFDGSDDYLVFPSLSIPSCYTITTLFKSAGIQNTEGYDSAGSFLSWDETDGNHNYDFRFFLPSDNKITARWDTNSYDGTTLESVSTISHCVWESASGVQEASNFRIYLDAVEDASNSVSSHLSGTVSGVIGRSYRNSGVENQFYGGLIGEWRFSNIARSANWEGTTNNSFDVSTFLSFGSETAR